ncbi:unnamed protein product [Amoebophrya sp. A120]|nr:unnamed protein product [Amoebophrya sp. A120]|eukprot:GSA120T00001054001.1
MTQRASPSRGRRAPVSPSQRERLLVDSGLDQRSRLLSTTQHGAATVSATTGQLVDEEQHPHSAQRHQLQLHQKPLYHGKNGAAARTYHIDPAKYSILQAGGSSSSSSSARTGNIKTAQSSTSAGAPTTTSVQTSAADQQERSSAATFWPPPRTMAREPHGGAITGRSPATSSSAVDLPVAVAPSPVERHREVVQQLGGSSVGTASASAAATSTTTSLVSATTFGAAPSTTSSASISLTGSYMAELSQRVDEARKRIKLSENFSLHSARGVVEYPASGRTTRTTQQATSAINGDTNEDISSINTAESRLPLRGDPAASSSRVSSKNRSFDVLPSAQVAPQERTGVYSFGGGAGAGAAPAPATSGSSYVRPSGGDLHCGSEIATFATTNEAAFFVDTNERQLEANVPAESDSGGEVPSEDDSELLAHEEKAHTVLSPMLPQTFVGNKTTTTSVEDVQKLKEKYLAKAAAAATTTPRTGEEPQTVPSTTSDPVVVTSARSRLAQPRFSPVAVTNKPEVSTSMQLVGQTGFGPSSSMKAAGSSEDTTLISPAAGGKADCDFAEDGSQVMEDTKPSTEQLSYIADHDPPPADNAASTMERVQVAVRIRPLISREAQNGCAECVVCPNGSSSLDNSNPATTSAGALHSTLATPHFDPVVAIGQQRYTFDYVFGTDSTQQQVFETCCRPLVPGVFEGLNASLLAYGQTSAGKTYTLGSFAQAVHNGLGDAQSGMIPKFVQCLFAEMEKRKTEKFLVRCSFLELHNEELKDLLASSSLSAASTATSSGGAAGASSSSLQGLVIREDRERGVVVSGLREVEVRTASDLLKVLDRGAVYRTTGATLMNDYSSRSHAVFSVVVERQKQDGDCLTAKLRFVDLAGSERVKKTGTMGDRFREGVAINQGLLALGNVIAALGDASLNKAHVPYRDSRLTRLLQDSLGGNSRTVMLACVSPADVNFGESLNTLKYANRARNIKNKVSQNLNVEDAELVKMKQRIQELQLELLIAKTDMSGRGAGGITSATMRSDGQISDVVAELREQLDRFGKENKQLQSENTELKIKLREASEETEKLRAQHNFMASKLFTTDDDGDTNDLASNGEGDLEKKALKAYLKEIDDQKKRIRNLESRLQKAVADQKIANNNSSELQRVIAQSRAQVLVDASSSQQILVANTAPREATSNNTGSAATASAAEEPPLDMDELEDLTHAATDQAEEETFRKEQQNLQERMVDLEKAIAEKEKLMEQLCFQERAFYSMKQRYESRCKELEDQIANVQADKLKLEKEISEKGSSTTTGPLSGSATTTPTPVSSSSNQKQALLQGKLAEVNRHLTQLQRQQQEAQRLFRAKEAQERRMLKMGDEIARLRGQRDTIQHRVRQEENRFRKWKKEWQAKYKNLQEENNALTSKIRRQQVLAGTPVTYPANVSGGSTSTLRSGAATPLLVGTSQPRTPLGLGGLKWNSTAAASNAATPVGTRHSSGSTQLQHPRGSSTTSGTTAGGVEQTSNATNKTQLLSGEIAQRKLWVEREMARAQRLKDANTKLERDLRERDDKVSQLQQLNEELQKQLLTNGDDEQMLREEKETLQAELQYDTDRIAETQKELAELLQGDNGTGTSTSSSATCSSTTSRWPASGTGDRAGATTSFGAKLFEKLQSHRNVATVCVAALDQLDEAFSEAKALKTRLQSLEAEIEQGQLVQTDLQQRLDVQQQEAERELAEIQRLHVEKELALLNEVQGGVTSSTQVEGNSAGPSATSTSPAKQNKPGSGNGKKSSLLTGNHHNEEDLRSEQLRLLQEQNFDLRKQNDELRQSGTRPADEPSASTARIFPPQGRDSTADHLQDELNQLKETVTDLRRENAALIAEQASSSSRNSFLDHDLSRGAPGDHIMEDLDSGTPGGGSGTSGSLATTLVVPGSSKRSKTSSSKPAAGTLSKLLYELADEAIAASAASSKKTSESSSGTQSSGSSSASATVSQPQPSPLPAILAKAQALLFDIWSDVGMGAEKQKAQLSILEKRVIDICAHELEHQEYRWYQLRKEAGRLEEGLSKCYSITVGGSGTTSASTGTFSASGGKNYTSGSGASGKALNTGGTSTASGSLQLPAASSFPELLSKYDVRLATTVKQNGFYNQGSSTSTSHSSTEQHQQLQQPCGANGNAVNNTPGSFNINASLLKGNILASTATRGKKPSALTAVLDKYSVLTLSPQKHQGDLGTSSSSSSSTGPANGLVFHPIGGAAASSSSSSLSEQNSAAVVPTTPLPLHERLQKLQHVAKDVLTEQVSQLRLLAEELYLVPAGTKAVGGRIAKKWLVYGGGSCNIPAEGEEQAEVDVDPANGRAERQSSASTSTTSRASDVVLVSKSSSSSSTQATSKYNYASFTPGPRTLASVQQQQNDFSLQEAHDATFLQPPKTLWAPMSGVELRLFVDGEIASLTDEEKASNLLTPGGVVASTLPGGAGAGEATTLAPSVAGGSSGSGVLKASNQRSEHLLCEVAQRNQELQLVKRAVAHVKQKLQKEISRYNNRLEQQGPGLSQEQQVTGGSFGGGSFGSKQGASTSTTTPHQTTSDASSGVDHQESNSSSIQIKSLSDARAAKHRGQQQGASNSSSSATSTPVVVVDLSKKTGNTPKNKDKKQSSSSRTSEQEIQSVISSTPCSFFEVRKLELELERLQEECRAEVAGARVELAELWEELQTPEEERNGFTARVKSLLNGTGCKSSGTDSHSAASSTTSTPINNGAGMIHLSGVEKNDTGTTPSETTSSRPTLFGAGGIAAGGLSSETCQQLDADVFATFAVSLREEVDASTSSSSTTVTLDHDSSSSQGNSYSTTFGSFLGPPSSASPGSSPHFAGFTLLRQSPLKALLLVRRECHHLRVKTEARAIILRKYDQCVQLKTKIREFEANTQEKGADRFKGNSILLLQEEQQRNRLRRKKEKLVEELLQKVEEWENCCQEKFLLHDSDALLKDEIVKLQMATNI